MNMYEWMCCNAHRIVEAVKEEGGTLNGPKVQGLLDEAQLYAQHGRIRDQARELLKIKLERAGFKGLIS